MHRFEDILFSPLARHDDPGALPHILDLVGRDGAKLTLLGVAAKPARRQRLFHRQGRVDEIARTERSRLGHEIQRWVGRASMDPDIGVVVGDPGPRIIEQVLAEGHDLVAVTSDEDRRHHATIRRLLRKCPCPVWVIRPTRPGPQRVLAAVNPDPGEVDLNRTILELASSMVDLDGGELHVVHAWELYGEPMMRSSVYAREPPATLEALLEEERTRRGEALAALLAGSTDDTVCQVHLVKGKATEVVPALVTDCGVNLLVMGTVARRGVTAMVMGNTAERVLDNVDCSVIAVKPAGSGSPLTAPGS